MTSRLLVLLPLTLALAQLAACGGEPPPPPAPPTPPSPAKVEAPPPPAPEPSAVASAEPEKPRSSGRPPVLFSDATEVAQSFGSSPAAKVEIGVDKERAVFRIPENALHLSHNIVFKLDARGKSVGGQVGKIYRVIPTSPPAVTPVRIDNTDLPFQLEFSTGGKKDVNLAIGEIDAAGKVKWEIRAPKHVDEGAGVAFFEVPYLTNSYVHLTSKPVQPPK